MIGRFVGAAPLGIYNRAFMLVNLPAQQLTSSFSRVLFPSFSRVQNETARLKKAYLSTIMLFSAILLPTCLGMAAAAREIVLLVLGENWSAAIPVLQILAIAAPLNLLSHFGGIVCEATGTLNVKLLMQVVYVCLLAILFYFIRGLGVREFAMAIAFAELIRFVAYLFIVKQICTVRAMEYVHVFWPSIVSSFIIGVSIYFIATLLRGFHISLILLFAAEVIAGAGLLIIIFLYGPQQVLRQELSERLKNSGIFSLDNKFFSWFYRALSAD
jgi:O-antigen/teichoic acid export membrane protein